MAGDDEDQLFAMGNRMAQIHLASNDYSPAHERRPMGLKFLVDEPVTRLKEFWTKEHDTKREILLTSAEEARERIEALLSNEEETEDSWGPIGGDFHSSNTRFDEHNNPTFFNFDLCGSGWRAYDIAAFLSNTNLLQTSEGFAEALFAGYYSVRPLSREEHAAVSPFLTLRRIWRMGLFALDSGLAGYTFLAPA